MDNLRQGQQTSVAAAGLPGGRLTPASSGSNMQGDGASVGPLVRGQ